MRAPRFTKLNQPPALTRVVQDDDVCGVQVDAQATSTRGQQEDELVAALLHEKVTAQTGRAAQRLVRGKCTTKAMVRGEAA